MGSLQPSLGNYGNCPACGSSPGKIFSDQERCDKIGCIWKDCVNYNKWYSIGNWKTFCESERKKKVICKEVFSWKDKYRLQLCIFDHLHEVPLLVDEWRKNKTEHNEANFKKEMMDLFILLNMWKEDNSDLYEQRLSRFKEKDT